MNTIKTLYQKYKELINYLIVGGLTTVVSLGVYYGCVLTFLNPEVPVQLQAANVLSWIAAVTFAYFTNRKYVFESKNEKRLQEAAAFLQCDGLADPFLTADMEAAAACINTAAGYVLYVPDGDTDGME